MNKKDAAAYVGISVRSLENWATRGRLSVRYVAGKTSKIADFDEAELAALKAEIETPVERLAVAPGEPTAALARVAHNGGPAGPGFITLQPEHFPALVEAIRGSAQPAQTSSADLVGYSVKHALTLPEAVALSGFSKDELVAAIHAGVLPAIKRKKWKIQREALERWSAAQFETPGRAGEEQ